MYSIYGAIEKLLSCRPKAVNTLFKLSEEGVPGRFGHLGRHFWCFTVVELFATNALLKIR